MKYARVINNTAVDVCDTDPTTRFHPTIAAEFETVPEEVQQGWNQDADGNWAAPAAAPAEDPAPPRPTVGAIGFKLLFTSPERLTLKSLRATDAVIDDFFEIIEDPRLDYIDMALTSTQGGVDYCLARLVDESVITAEDQPARREQILSGQAV